MQLIASNSLFGKGCVSVGLIVSDGSNGLLESINSVLMQAECLELYVLCPNELKDEVLTSIASKILDRRVVFAKQNTNNYIDFVNITSNTFRGAFYSFIREGDQWTTSMLGSSIKKLNADPRLLLTHGFADKIDFKLGARQPFRSLRNAGNISAFGNGFSIALSTVVIKRPAWLLLNGFDQCAGKLFDLDFAIRAVKYFSNRIAFIPRFQCDLCHSLDEQLPADIFFRRILDNLRVLERHGLQGLELLSQSIKSILSSVDSFEEFNSIRKEYSLLIQDAYDLSVDAKALISKRLLLEESQWNSAVSLEERCRSIYESDGLAASLISCIYPELHSGSFSYCKGPYIRYCDFREKHIHSISSIKKRKNYDDLLSGQKVSRGFRKLPFGVNLVGHAFDVFGLGESLRMMARAFLSAGIPISIVDVPANNGCNREQNFLESYLPDSLEKSAPYAFNIICMSAASHAKWLLDGGFECTIGRYSIGAWFWETSTWPQPWSVLLRFVDSAWPASELIKSSLEKVCKKENVILTKMSFPAEISNCLSYMRSNSRNDYRARFRLPLDKTIFVFAFDTNSCIERKNPMACIRVFIEAFGDPSDNTRRNDVCLVIKTFIPRKESQEWIDLLDIASYDDRIILIAESLDREELIGLYSACDIFMSLHRSEGYGLGMAEALQLGLKVIATNYGGNVDFCVGKSSYLVKNKLVPIGFGVYPYADGHWWAEPSLKDAADLCTVACSKSQENISAPEHVDLIDHSFSIKKAARTYKEMLSNLYY